MGEFSLSHMLILALILLLFFGPSKLPALGQSLGKAIRGFKDGMNEMNAQSKDVGPQTPINAPKSETAKTEEKDHNKTETKS